MSNRSIDLEAFIAELVAFSGAPNREAAMDYLIPFAAVVRIAEASPFGPIRAGLVAAADPRQDLP